MDALTFISSLVTSVVSWPLAIVVIIYLLREPLKELLRSLKNFQNLRLSAPGISFDATLREAEQAAERVEREPVAGRVTGAIKYFGEPEEEEEGEGEGEEEEEEEAETTTYVSEEADRLYALSTTDPSSAILESWILLERTVYELAQKAGIENSREVPYTNATVLLAKLRSLGLVRRSLLDLALNLSKARNSVVHPGPGTVVTPPTNEQALSYVTLALQVERDLRRQLQEM